MCIRFNFFHFAFCANERSQDPSWPEATSSGTRLLQLPGTVDDVEHKNQGLLHMYNTYHTSAVFVSLIVLLAIIAYPPTYMCIYIYIYMYIS